MQPQYKLSEKYGDYLQGFLLASMKAPPKPVWDSFAEDVAREVGPECTMEKPKSFTSKEVSNKRYVGKNTPNICSTCMELLTLINLSPLRAMTYNINDRKGI